VGGEDAKILRHADYSIFFICLFTFITHFFLCVLYSVVSTDPELKKKMPYVGEVTSLFFAISAIVNFIFYSLLIPRYIVIKSFGGDSFSQP
jgi:hypothetical protein